MNFARPLVLLLILHTSHSLRCFSCGLQVYKGTDKVNNDDKAASCNDEAAAEECLEEGQVCVQGNGYDEPYRGKILTYSYYKGCEFPCGDTGLECNEITCDTDLCNGMLQQEVQDYVEPTKLPTEAPEEKEEEEGDGEEEGEKEEDEGGEKDERYDKDEEEKNDAVADNSSNEIVTSVAMVTAITLLCWL